MSNTPIPVPSKAAVRALRGLAFGTTCTLAIVTEDRRRRINNARNAITNAERLRSAKQYHAGGTAFAVALEEEFLVESNPMYWKRYDQSRKPEAQRAQSVNTAAQPQVAKSTRSAGERADYQHTESRRVSALPPAVNPLKSAIPNVFACSPTEPKSALLRRALDNQIPPVKQDGAAKANHLDSAKLIAQLETANTGNRQETIRAVKLLAVALTMDPMTQEYEGHLLEASARICTACQNLGMMSQARGILQLAIERGPLNEETYHSHNPFPVIRSMVTAEPNGEPNIATMLPRLRVAIALFLPKFTQPCQIPSPELFDTAKVLFEIAASCKYRLGVQQICRRLIAYQQVPAHVIESILTRLSHDQDHKYAVKLFCLLNPQENYDGQALQHVGDAIVQSVTATHGYRAETVLRRLLTLREPVLQLRTTWVTQLLYSEWQKASDAEHIAAVFRELFADNLATKVVHPDGVYRVMVQISLEAGSEVQAEELFDELVRLDPGAKSDRRVVGLFALLKAKSDDWVGVGHSFDDMLARGPFSVTDSDRVFVPVLKEYSRTHTLGETEDFMKLYIDRKRIPLCRQMVTLLANQYGEMRDKTSFIQWLKYCADAGFKIDAAFSNSILVNCKKHWQFSYPELRSLFFRFRQLNPDAEDDVTQRIMLTAAVQNSKSTSNGGRSLMGKSLNLGAKPSNRSRPGRCADSHDVLLLMKQAMVRGQSSRAISIYKQAVDGGLPHSEECLKAAVIASLRGAKNDRICVMDMMREAQGAGHDISDVATPLLVAQLDAADTRGSHQESFRALKKTLQHFEELQLQLSDFALNRAALHLCKVKHFTGAIAFAHSAAELSGKRPGYNEYNFSNLVWAYAGVCDVDGLALVIAGADEATIRNRMSYTAMKKARRLLRSCADEPGAQRGLAAIGNGLERSRIGRQDLASDKQQLNAVALEIMAQAAREAGSGIQNPPWHAKKNPENEVDGASFGSALDEDLGFLDARSEASDVESTSVRTEPLAAHG